MVKAAITGVGGYVPETILSNKDLEQMVDTTDEWILSRTGIKERRILKEPYQGCSTLAVRAAQDLIEKKGIDPKSIDLVLIATITPDYQVAATAAYVASSIGATNAFAFDLSAACSGFLYGMSVATGYIQSGRYNRVLFIGADKMSSIVNYKDRTTCIIFGDGAGAVLIEPSTNQYGWEDEYFRSNGAARESLLIKGGGSIFPTSQSTLDQGWHNLYQDGKTVFKYAVSEMTASTQKIIERNHLSSEEINYLVPHQANKRIIDATAKQLGLAEDKVLMNIERYGNTTAATIPLLLYDYEQQLACGDKILFAAFGGGFTWGAAYLTWAY
ncbi:MAG: 3-oxoacyl-ACP synthase [Flavobacteriales bacterium MED-G22]|nr:MAG: 3-oxoacyl-ACP synthase [Flavobacteriales bacterium MED-G22]|tara:strand:+ start:1390 stop:2373 length:984 start_codon:yes stop_codon:yes gene_type:complete